MSRHVAASYEQTQMSIAKENFEITPTASKTRPDTTGIIALVVAVALMITLYYGTITWWVYEWTREGSFYAHGIFIPFFVGLMIWRDKERLRRLPVERNWWGIIPVAFAIALVLLAERAQVTVPVSISFILFLIGSTLVVAGKKMTRALLFPMLFLFTMIPIVPDQLINPIAFPIQLTSAKMAASICNLIGFPAVRIGTQINMEHFPLNVELPCSGFKTLLGLLSFSAAFAYVVKAETWKRWLMFAVSGPLAIIVNGVRITLIGLAGEVFGTAAAHTFHDYSGFIVLILGFMFLFNFAKVIKCESFLGVPLYDEPVKKPAEGTDEAPVKRTEEEIKQQEATKRAEEQADYDAKWGAPRKYSLGFIGAGLYPVIVLLLLAVVAKPAITAPKPPIGAVMAADIRPELNGKEWTQSGQDIPITEEVKSALNPISYINRNYVGSASNPASVELLLTAGNGRKVFHDPHTCFLGSGYDMRDVRVETVDSPVGPVKVQVSEAENTQDHTKTLLMFCYVVDGTQYQTTQQVNTALMFQLLFGDSGRPSYFLRFRQRSPGVDKPQQEELRSFIRAVWTEIAPKVMGADKLKRVASK